MFHMPQQLWGPEPSHHCLAMLEWYLFTFIILCACPAGPCFSVPPATVGAVHCNQRLQIRSLSVAFTPPMCCSRRWALACFSMRRCMLVQLRHLLFTKRFIDQRQVQLVLLVQLPAVQMAVDAYVTSLTVLQVYSLQGAGVGPLHLCWLLLVCALAACMLHAMAFRPERALLPACATASVFMVFLA